MLMVLKTLLICYIFIFTGIVCLNAQEVNPVTDLPLQLSKGKGGKVGLIIYLTGDGGWNSFNQQMTQTFEKQGYGVVALNTRKYFWSEKTPEGFARDFEKLSNYYLKEWGKSSLIIVGYSFGADVASFLPNRLSVELKDKIKKIVLLSPSASTDFVIRLGDMMGGNENINRKYKVKQEIEKTVLPIVCIFGDDEVMSLKDQLVKSRNLIISELPGDHRYSNNFSLVIKMMGI
jgi:type IV secretory pathway VirJ component